MSALEINADAEGRWPDMAAALRAELVAVGGLAGGTELGLPSVAFKLRLADGRLVFAETTLRLFLTAADALKAYHGDPRHDERTT